LKILIVDDHPLVCSGIRNILLTVDGISDVVEANDIQTALNYMGKYDFSLAMVDMRLKNEDGIDFIKAAKSIYPGCNFVILSSSSTSVDFSRAMQAGVDGYILKDALPEDIVYAVKSVLRNKKYFDPVFMEKISSLNQRSLSDNPSDQLSPREQEILECLGKGLSNKNIASKLCISENTVKKHVSNILEKLNLDDRTQAALYISKSCDKNQL